MMSLWLPVTPILPIFDPSPFVGLFAAYGPLKFSNGPFYEFRVCLGVHK